MRIWMLYSERSGSNLLRVMLGAHPLVHAPSPPHIAKLLAPLAHLYGNLADDARAEELVGDMLALARTQVDPWREIPTAAGVIELADATWSRGGPAAGRTFWRLYDALYLASARAAGKPHYVNKENDLFRWAWQAMAHLGPAQTSAPALTGNRADTTDGGGLRFVYLARDGRDVACSLRRAPGGDEHVYPIALGWRREQRACLEIASALVGKPERDAERARGGDPHEVEIRGASPRGSLSIASTHRLHALRYEDLVTRSGAELQRLCAAIGLPFDEAMLSYHRTPEARRTAAASPFWSNVAQPPMPGNTAKYATCLRRWEAALFERLAGAELTALGYPLDAPAADVRRADDVRGSVRWFFLAWNLIAKRLRRGEADAAIGRRERREAVGRIKRRLEARGAPVRLFTAIAEPDEPQQSGRTDPRP